jgi:hypothetical protein
MNIIMQVMQGHMNRIMQVMQGHINIKSIYLLHIFSIVRDSLITILMRYGLVDLEIMVRIRAGVRESFLFHPFRPILEPTKHPIKWVVKAPSKGARCEGNHLRSPVP